MAIVTRKDFASLCKRTIGYVNVNIQRNKISVLDYDTGLLDTDNALNKIFKKNCEMLDAGKIITPHSNRAKKDKKLKEENPEPVQPAWKIYDNVIQKEEIPKEKSQYEKEQEKKKKQDDNDEEFVDWDRRKKIADTLKAEKSAELTNLQVEKLMGNLMPVDMVEQIIKVNLQDIFKTFENEAINIASIYCDILAGGDRTKLSELINKLRHAISATIKRAEQVSAQEIENVINEYSESRNRGEKK